jgi:hypothetical protein
VLTEIHLTFDEFNEYLASFDDSALDVWRERGLPENKSDFESWWRDMKVSDQLGSRWFQRIKSKNRLLLHTVIRRNKAA